jgi:hypothetical protein
MAKEAVVFKQKRDRRTKYGSRCIIIVFLMVGVGVQNRGLCRFLAKVLEKVKKSYLDSWILPDLISLLSTRFLLWYKLWLYWKDNAILKVNRVKTLAGQDMDFGR